MNAGNPDPQAALEDRLRFETVLAELSAQFVNLPPERVDREIEEALRRLVAALRVDRTALGRLSEDGQDFVVTHSFALPGVEAFPLIPSLATVAPLMSRTLLNGQPFVMVRLADLPAEGEVDRQLFESLNIRSGMVVPLMIGGRVIGGLGCSLAREERAWPESVVQSVISESGFQWFGQFWFSASWRIELRDTSKIYRTHQFFPDTMLTPIRSARSRTSS